MTQVILKNNNNQVNRTIMNNLIRKQTSTLQTQFTMENQENDALLNSIGRTIQKIRLENEYNGEIRILQSYSRNIKTVYYTSPFQEDLDKLIKSKTRSKVAESDQNLIIHKLNENSKYNRPYHRKN